MTEQRIIEIFKDNVKACIKENTPISVVNNLPVEMAFVGLKEAAQQIMNEFDNIKEVPEYVEIVEKRGKFEIGEICLVKQGVIIGKNDSVRAYGSFMSMYTKPSTKEAYEQQQEEWPKDGDDYFTIGLGQKDFVLSYKWGGAPTEKLWKERGLIFRTKEEAIEAAKKMTNSLQDKN